MNLSSELIAQAWVTRYLSETFIISEVNEMINDFNYALTHKEQKRVISLLKLEYDAGRLKS